MRNEHDLDLDRFAAILERLASPFDGERAAAALLASRELRRVGLTWPDLLRPRLAVPPPPMPPTPDHWDARHWRETLHDCQRRSHLAREWEVGFLNSVGHFAEPSQKQLSTLRSISRQLADREARK